MRFFAFCLFLSAFMPAFSQELEVTVTVNTPILQTADPRVFQDLRNTVQSFMNNQKWTGDAYQQDERIRVTVSINITQEFSATSFGGELLIQAVRPVYGSGYETPLISHLDKDLTFAYEQFQPLEYSENSFNDNLSSILSFYAYIILGLDYDSFSPFGGDLYYQTAQDIVNNIPSAVSANNPGWRSLEGNRNRYWIAENLLSPRVRPFRQALYDYHLHGLDLMHRDANAGRAILLQALEECGKVNIAYPNSMIVQMFMNAKSTELIEIFKGAPLAEKNRVVPLLTKLDGANASKYRGIKG